MRPARLGSRARKRRAIRTLGAAWGAAAVAGCSILDPTFAEPAVIMDSGAAARIEAPDAVARDTPFRVSIETIGGGCTRRVSRTKVDVSGLLAEVRPYNETRRGGVCTSDLLSLPHYATIRFDRPGTATIRFIGRQVFGANDEARLDRILIVR